MAESRRWLTVREIVADLGVSDETVYGWLRSGELRSKRFGQQYRVRADWYAAWCESRPDGETAQEPERRELPAARTAKRAAGQPIKRLVDIGALRAERQAALGGGR